MATAYPTKGGVQSVERTFDLLEYILSAGGEMGISEAAVESGLPLPTIHRLLQTLVARGYVRQQPSRRYALGPRLIPIGDGAQRMVGRWAQRHLEGLAEVTGETANMALLDGDLAIYVAQVPSRHPMRMFTEIGRRVSLHCTGIGKVLLAQMSESKARELLKRTGMSAQTDKTITDLDTLIEQLVSIRQLGYALDDGEQEVGVRCVAVPVPDGRSLLTLSVSGPESRISYEAIEGIAISLKQAALEFAIDLAAEGS